MEAHFGGGRPIPLSSGRVTANEYRIITENSAAVLTLYKAGSSVGPARFERATSCSGGKRSIQLSYGPGLR